MIPVIPITLFNVLQFCTFFAARKRVSKQNEFTQTDKNNKDRKYLCNKNHQPLLNSRKVQDPTF